MRVSRFLLFPLVLSAYILLTLPFASAQVGDATVLIDEDDVAATTTGDSETVSGWAYVGRIEAAKVSGTNPTLDAVIQHSPDCVNWSTLLTFTQITTSTAAIENVHINKVTTNVFPCVRAVATLGGSSPVYDIKITLFAGD
jgi:hypothetical protein